MIKYYVDYLFFLVGSHALGAGIHLQLYFATLIANSRYTLFILYAIYIQKLYLVDLHIHPRLNYREI